MYIDDQAALWMIYVFVFIVGAMVGSFLNVVAYRLPQILYDQQYQNISDFLIEEFSKTNNSTTGIPLFDKLFRRENAKALLTKRDVLPVMNRWAYIAFPPSSCPNCGHKIKFYENVPILGWLMLKGRCSGCKIAISPQYPIVELFTALLTVITVWRFGISYEALLYVLLVWVFIALSLIDMKCYLLPDMLTLPMLWLGMLSSYFDLISVSFLHSFLGVIVGYLVLWTINLFALIVFKKPGIGHGDFKLLAMLGAWLGVGSIFNIVFMSSLFGALVGLIVVLGRKDKKDHYIPFGPFLVLSGLVVLLSGIRPDLLLNLI